MDSMGGARLSAGSEGAGGSLGLLLAEGLGDCLGLGLRAQGALRGLLLG